MLYQVFILPFLRRPIEPRESAGRPRDGSLTLNLYGLVFMRRIYRVIVNITGIHDTIFDVLSAVCGARTRALYSYTFVRKLLYCCGGFVPRYTWYLVQASRVGFVPNRSTRIHYSYQ